MPWIEIENLGAQGIIRDRHGFSLPTEFWTDGANIRVTSNQIRPMKGWERHFTPVCQPQIIFGLSNPVGKEYYIVYACSDKVYAFDNANHHDITPAAGLLPAIQWTGDLINGNLVLSNGVDEPIYWDIVLTNPMQDLPDLDGMESCRVIRSHKGFLFALDCVISGSRYPARCRWSGQAEVGLPPTWDPVGSLAGEVDLGDSDQELIDAAILRDHLIVYGSRQTFDVTFVGGDFVWRFDTLFQNTGILGVHCVREFEGQHIVLAPGDVLVHNGHNIQSVITDDDRKWMFGIISDTAYQKSFVGRDHANDEMWICFPKEGADYPCCALVWDFRHDTWGISDLPEETVFLGNTRDLLQSGGNFYQYTTIPGTYVDMVTTAWTYEDLRLGVEGQPADSPNPSILAMLSASKGDVYRFNTGNSHAGTPRHSWVERTDLHISPQRATIRRMRPRLVGGPVEISIGGQDVPGGPVRWQGPFKHEGQKDKDIHCRVQGLRHAVKIESTADVDWCINNYALDVEEMGDR